MDNTIQLLVFLCKMLTEGSSSYNLHYGQIFIIGFSAYYNTMIIISGRIGFFLGGGFHKMNGFRLLGFSSIPNINSVNIGNPIK